MTVAVARRLGRFELLRELGRGAQARVWLAHDPRLEREVALKLLDAGAGADAVNEWLHEARAVSRLSHANIVPVFEADAHAGQPYMVFEYVEGPTLAQARAKKPRFAPREAAQLMLGVLDALAAAHAQGIVHRDLKPSNILLGGDGRPRVMDFGIAARTAVGSTAGDDDGRIVGTAGYISPEAARGAAPVPAMDVFAAGVVLGELLAGEPLLRETDPMRALHRVQHEDLELPASAAVDATLRGIVQRALSRDGAARYDSARAMHAALAAWLAPTSDVDPAAGGSSAALEFLLRRMRHKTDFPALSESVVRIQRLATSDTESIKSLSDEILRDVALTNKLLRLVNMAHFTSVAGGGITTVSRAVALVGFAGIRNLALSVLLLEHMGDKTHAAQLKEEFLRALTAGTLAGALSPLARESEEAFLAAMFQNLGRLLTEYYFPEEAVLIRQQVGADDTVTARDVAARKLLGIGLQDLGAGVAKAWGLPDTLQRALRVPVGDAPSQPASAGVERLRWLGRGANAMTAALLHADGDAQTHALQRAAETYAPVLGVSPRAIVAATLESRMKIGQVAQALGLHVARHAPARRLLEAAPPAAGAKAAAADRTIVEPRSGAVPGAAPPAALPAPPVSPASAEAAAPPPMQAELASGLADLRGALAGSSLRLNEVLTLVLETMHRALRTRWVVLCLREPKSGHLVGRLGLGDGADEVAAVFRIALDAAAGDLFAALCAKKADLLVADARSVATHLPAWWKRRVAAGSFLVLPLHINGAAIGMIYADQTRANTLTLGDGELALLRSLRDEAVAAFRRGT